MPAAWGLEAALSEPARSPNLVSACPAHTVCFCVFVCVCMCVRALSASVLARGVYTSRERAHTRPCGGGGRGKTADGER